MKNLSSLLFCLLCISFTSAQEIKSIQQKYLSLEPAQWLNIYDAKNSDPSLKVDTLRYHQIPNYLDYKGTVVEALSWKDKLGENILLLTNTGVFEIDYMSEYKEELYAYLFVKKAGEKDFKRKWRLYDFSKCGPVEIGSFFVRKALTITDLNKDGIAEIAFLYVLMCRGDISNDTLKYIMYEDTTKYALRGQTQHCDFPDEYQIDGGGYVASSNLMSQALFMNFLHLRWQ